MSRRQADARHLSRDGDPAPLIVADDPTRTALANGWQFAKSLQDLLTEHR
jgi:hypothetical protein